ncbi:GDSL-type esterase/lipase family protein [Promicromonospora sp. CA-289599]|uniref:GDSL-type esterase/lipase family protein n=1 Tax=Promicromonospora sp. CA-289599 TaxID=3240014 RepID=UPI003D8B3F11
MSNRRTAARRRPRPGLALAAAAAMVLTPLAAAAQPAAAVPYEGSSELSDADVVVRSSFDDRPAGRFVRGTEGWDVDVATGNSVNVVSVPSADDRSVRVSRTAGTGASGSALARVFETPLTGVVTVSARVMRSDSEGGFFGLPYLYDEAGRPAVSVALARGDILAYDGRTSRTIGTYEAGRWYDIDLTVDTSAQTFDLTIDGRRALDDAAPRTSLTGISRIAWYANGGERGAVHVDDIAVTRTDFAVDPVTYYVSTDGDDRASGTSPDAAWRSLQKVGATTFAPGDRIRLRSGDTWTGQLWPKGSGVPGHPITVDAYGEGAKPRIAGAGTVAEAVRLFNQEHWVIRGLDVSNAAPSTGTPGENLRDLRGIGVHGDSGAILDHFVIDAVDVHDVTGEINWIGGTAADTPGVHWGTGWDRSKNTGGIVFRTTTADPAAPGRATVLTGITVQDSTVKNTSFAGITVKQWTGNDPAHTATGWGTRRTADDVRFTPHTDITIRGNYLTQAGTDYGANGVYLTDARDALVEGNLVDRVGVSGIETYAADRVTVQHNEITGTKWAQGSADANGMDPDIATTNQLFQYNYLHGNGDGILLCACSGNHPFGSAVVRYNVVTGSERWNLHMSQTSGSVAHVYNNTFVSSEAPNMVSGSNSGTVTLTNNVFASSRGASFAENSRLTYENNAYSPALSAPSSDPSALTGDPRFVDPGFAGPYGDETSGPRLEEAGAYALTAESPFIDMGVPVADDGGHDLAGTSVPVGDGPEVGAFEYTTRPGQTTNAAITYIDEAFDTQTDPRNFGFGDRARVVDGVLRLTEGMANYTTAVAPFAAAVRDQRTLDLSFDWKTGITSSGMKTGLELRDSAGNLAFGLAATGSELRYAVTGPASDSSAAPDRLNPAWTRTAFDRTKWHTVDLHMDFTVGTVQYTVSTREASPRVLASGTGQVSATNLDRLVAANYYGTGPQSVDNVLLRRPAHPAEGDLEGRSVYAFGDSIVAGHAYARGFVNLVAEREGFSLTKYARNGATVMEAGYPAGTVRQQVRAARATSPDLVVFDGGTNDAEAIFKAGRAVGSVSETFDPAGFESGTYAGAFEATVYEMRSKWPSARIVYVAAHKLGSRDWGTQLAVRDVTLQAAEKWGVTVADVFADTTFDTRDQAQRVNYTFDGLIGGYPGTGGSGTHPNIAGMTRFYVPVLTEALGDVVRSQRKAR